MKPQVLYIFIALVMLTGSLHGQSKKDSLRQLLANTKSDTTKVWLLHDLSRQHMMSNVDSMMVTLHEALELSQKINFLNGEVATMHRLSRGYEFKGDKENEKAYTRAAFELAKKHEVYDWLGQIYNHMGSIYFKELKYDSAYHAYIEAEKVHQSIGKEYIAWQTNLFLFRLFAAQKEKEKAEQYLQKAYEITKAKGIRMDFGWVLTERLKHYFHAKDWNNYVQASEEFLAFQNERKKSLRSNLYHKNLFFYTDENKEEIIKEVKALIPYHESNKNLLSLAETYSFMGSIQQQLGDHSGAVTAYQKSISYVKTIKNKAVEAELYKKVYESYEADNQLAKAYPYLKAYQHLIDSLNNVDIQKNLGALEVRYQTAKKDEELAQQQLALQQSKQSRRIFTILGIAGSLLALVALWFLYFKNKTNRLLKSKNKVIEKALTEKEILLKEIHHRVKNNLQVVSSLLNWQSRYIQDHKALKSMQEGRNRVQSMALIHQNLYQSDDLTGVEVADYIDKLSNSLFNSYNIRKEQVSFQSNVEPLTLDVDTLIPLGLILNELLSNALKHAFPEGREGQIEVTLQQNQESLLLEVKDNGVGISKEKDSQSKDSFGYKLIEAFAEKLKAQLQIENNYGTTVRLLIQNFKAS